MSMFGDYKAYKKYEPNYDNWKRNRDITEAKRQAYIKKHPEIVNKNDIQRGQILLRAIDIMDEYSQKRAENMEAATESIINMGLELALFAGLALGALVGKIKPVGEFFQKAASKGSKYAKLIGIGIPACIGATVGAFAAFPLMAWGSKAEVGASRKGRFEAMNSDLKNPNGFAILTNEQLEEAKAVAKNIVLDDDKKKNITLKLTNGIKSLKDMAIDSDEYKQQRLKFERELKEDEQNLNKNLTDEEIAAAKRDQQLLTKLVEKIDIASQDYAENSELAVQWGMITIGAAGGILSIGVEKILNALKVKSAQKIGVITKILSLTAYTVMGIFAAQINKHASRVGRFKVKQELMKNPSNFVYVEDNKLDEIRDFELKTNKKPNLVRFLINAWKDNKEYNNYKKTTEKDERKLFKAIEKIKLSPKQTEEAKILQKNTFRTFNKVDENSQKYSESVEAFGQAVTYPLITVFSLVATAFALPYLFKQAKTNIERTNNFAKYFGIVILSSIPAYIINTLITKEQKKASRIANMRAIEELNDYRKFR